MYSGTGHIYVAYIRTFIPIHLPTRIGPPYMWNVMEHYIWLNTMHHFRIGPEKRKQKWLPTENHSTNFDLWPMLTIVIMIPSFLAPGHRHNVIITGVDITDHLRSMSWLRRGCQSVPPTWFWCVTFVNNWNNVAIIVGNLVSVSWYHYKCQHHWLA